MNVLMIVTVVLELSLEKFPDMDHRLRNVFKRNNLVFHSSILGNNISGENHQNESYREAFNDLYSENTKWLFTIFRAKIHVS